MYGTMGSGELRQRPEYDAGKDIVGVEGAVMHPDQLHHLAEYE